MMVDTSLYANTPQEKAKKEEEERVQETQRQIPPSTSPATSQQEVPVALQNEANQQPKETTEFTVTEPIATTTIPGGAPTETAPQKEAPTEETLEAEANLALQIATTYAKTAGLPPINVNEYKAGYIERHRGEPPLTKQQTADAKDELNRLQMELTAKLAAEAELNAKAAKTEKTEAETQKMREQLIPPALTLAKSKTELEKERVSQKGQTERVALQEKTKATVTEPSSTERLKLTSANALKLEKVRAQSAEKIALRKAFFENLPKPPSDAEKRLERLEAERSTRAAYQAAAQGAGQRQTAGTQPYATTPLTASQPHPVLTAISGTSAVGAVGGAGESSNDTLTAMGGNSSLPTTVGASKPLLTEIGGTTPYAQHDYIPDLEQKVIPQNQPVIQQPEAQPSNPPMQMPAQTPQPTPQTVEPIPLEETPEIKEIEAIPEMEETPTVIHEQPLKIDEEKHIEKPKEEIKEVLPKPKPKRKHQFVGRPPARGKPTAKAQAEFKRRWGGLSRQEVKVLKKQKKEERERG
jgi:hypothetical protein